MRFMTFDYSGKCVASGEAADVVLSLLAQCEPEEYARVLDCLDAAALQRDVVLRRTQRIAQPAVRAAYKDAVVADLGGQ